MSDTILSERQDAIAIIRINRPDKKNALTHAMYDGMRVALEQAAADASVRVVILTGTSDCFTAGNDLADFAAGLGDDFQSTAVGRFLMTAVDFPKPLIAAINGAAVGIGTTILLHCDLAYAGTNAKFQMPFVNLGLCPEAASSLLLPVWLGRVRASELLLTGSAFTAEKAERLGLVNEVLPPEETLPRAIAAATQIAAQPPAAIRLTKRLLQRGMHEVVRNTLRQEGELFLQQLGSDEAREAFSAFMAKRKPDFSRFS